VEDFAGVGDEQDAFGSAVFVGGDVDVGAARAAEVDSVAALLPMRGRTRSSFQKGPP